MKRISTTPVVVFDMFDVLDLPNVTPSIAERLGLTNSEYLECVEGFADALDRGQMDADELWLRVFNEFSAVTPLLQSPTQLAQWVDEIDRTTRRFNPAMRLLVEVLRTYEITVALASNVSWDLRDKTEDHHPEMYELFGKNKFLSCELGMKKTDAGFWQTLMYKLDRDPREIVFFDDTQANVDYAKRLRVDARLFKTLECRANYSTEDLLEAPYQVLDHLAHRLTPETVLGIYEDVTHGLSADCCNSVRTLGITSEP